MLTILGALLALWHHFWAQLRHLGVTFGAFWMHFSHQKTDWGAKGAQRGGTPVSESPFWTPFGRIFLIFLVLLEKIMWFTNVSFFHEFWVALSALWDRLICNPSTYMQSKHTFQFLHVFLQRLPKDLTMSYFSSNF